MSATSTVTQVLHDPSEPVICQYTG